MNELQTHKINLNDHQVAYAAIEREHPEKTLVFLHGWRSSSAVWQPVVEQLKNEEDLSLYLLDLPGFGLSENPQRTFGTRDYGEIVRVFIEKKDLENVVLVGHSFGGQVSLFLASEYPQLLERMVLAGSAGIRRDTSRKKMMRTVAQIVKPLFALPGMQPLRKKIYALIGSTDYLAREELVPTIRQIFSEDMSDRLAEVTCPTLLVWGTKDEETPLADGRHMSESIPTARLVEFPGSGHFPFVDDPNEFVKNLLSFVQA